jgi:hypothetical protein
VLILGLVVPNVRARRAEARRKVDWEREERTDSGPDVVEHPMHAEGVAEPFGIARRRDEGISRRCADALADPVRGDLGPFLAFLILLMVPDGFHIVFVASLVFATLGVLILGLVVPPMRRRGRAAWVLGPRRASPPSDVLPRAVLERSGRRDRGSARRSRTARQRLRRASDARQHRGRYRSVPRVPHPADGAGRVADPVRGDHGRHRGEPAPQQESHTCDRSQRVPHERHPFGESVSAILPLYITGFLGLSTIAFGVLDGLYQGTSAIVRGCPCRSGPR